MCGSKKLRGCNPSKLMMRVRFPLHAPSLAAIQSFFETICVHRIMAITSAFQADDAGSIPAARSI